MANAQKVISYQCSQCGNIEKVSTYPNYACECGCTDFRLLVKTK